MKLNKNVIIYLVIIFMFNFLNNVKAEYNKLIYDFKIESINGKIIDFETYRNKVILLVNVASNCGFTNQYSGLQSLWEDYKNKGLIVVGLPTNQFGGQEPGTENEIKDFCETNFNINFPMTKKIDVKGKNIDPLYKWAHENFGKSAIPKWNFHKILINKQGKIEETYNSFTKPQSKKIILRLEKILN